jgi:hypothetical protein
MRDMIKYCDEAATLENAKNWVNMQDKYIFCLDLLNMCIRFDGDDFCDYYVEMLEEKFELLLKNEGIDYE